MKKYLFILLLAIPFIAKAQYSPSLDGITINSPMAPAQQVPVDSRSYFHDRTLFLYRPYQSQAEVISYLPSIYRSGNTPIFICTGTLQSNGTFLGGNVNEWMFRRGIQDSQLVQINIDFPSGAGIGTVTNVSATSGGGYNWIITNPTTTPNIGLALSFGGDISGPVSAIQVNKFNGQTPAFYLNYTNLSNTPNIPAQFNPIAGPNISLSGTYPNITITSTTGAGTAGYAINSSLILGGVIALDSANYHTVNAVTNFDSLLIIHFNGGALDTLILPLGGGGGGSGTVTSFSFTNANGISGTVTNPSTAANLTLSLGAITPTSVNGLALLSLSTGFSISGGTTSRTETVTGSGTLSGNNSGDVTVSGQTYATLTGQNIAFGAVDLSGTNATGILAAARFPALTGPITTSAGSVATSITNNAVGLTKIQQIGPATLLGNLQAGTANVTTVGLGTGLRIDGTLLFVQVDTGLIATRFYVNQQLDSALVGTDTTFFQYQGSGYTLLRGTGNTLVSKTLVPGIGVSFTANGDSSLTINTSGSVGFSDTTITATSGFTVPTTYKNTTVIYNAATGTIVLPDPTVSANRNLRIYIRVASTGQVATITTPAGSIETSTGTFTSTATIGLGGFAKWTPSNGNWRLVDYQ